MPQWRSDYFRGAEELSTSGSSEREVVLFADTFNIYFEPENLRAAVRVLGAAGYTVRVAGAPGERPLCCGRTYLATGMVEEARAEARRLLEGLAPYVARGVPVVGLEPSCLLGLRDELPRLIPGSAAASLAERAFTFEEFIAAERSAGRFELELKPVPFKRALVHGHCHQKSFGVMPTVVSVLKLVPGLSVETIPSSCCGMAGAFGYQAETLSVSLQMAEASLLPAVRAAGADTVVIADGTSCRHQIHDGAQRNAQHVASVLAAAL